MELFAGATLKVRKKDLLIMKQGSENYGEDLLVYLLHGAESFLRSYYPVIGVVKKFPAFYGTRGSLQHSQQPATCPYMQLDQSSPCHPIALPEDPS